MSELFGLAGKVKAGVNYYNSNSMTSGILKAVGFKFPPFMDDPFPMDKLGFTKPVPLGKQP